MGIEPEAVGVARNGIEVSFVQDVVAVRGNDRPVRDTIFSGECRVIRDEPGADAHISGERVEEFNGIKLWRVGVG
jgi:hypothetical protein